MGRKNRRTQQPKRRRPIPFEHIKMSQAETSGSCPTGKLRYSDERNAWLALKSAQRKHAEAGKDQIERRYYVCEPPAGQPKTERHCGGYHLTHLDKMGD